MNRTDESNRTPEDLPARGPWQFSLRRLIAGVAGCAVIFGVVRLVATRPSLGMFLVFLLAISWPWAAGGVAAAMTCWCRGQRVQFQSDQFGCLVGLWSICFWIVYVLGTIAMAIVLSQD